MYHGSGNETHMSQFVIDTNGLSKRFRIDNSVDRSRYRSLGEDMTNAARSPIRTIRSFWKNGKDDFWALKDISLQIPRGEVVGIIGGNGAGKTTLLRVLSGITDPTEGYADIYGRVGTLLEVGAGFHQELTGRENTYMNGAVLGMKKAEIDRRFDEIIAFAEVDRFVDTPVKRYSTGMFMRLAFSIAAHLDTEIILVDEVLTVGDTAFQKKCLGKLDDVSQGGRTVLFVSHNMGIMRSLCKKGIVLDEGRIVETGDINTCVESYYRSIGAISKSDNDSKPLGGDSVFGPIRINGAQDATVLQSEGFEVSVDLRPGEVETFKLKCRLEDMQGRLISHHRRSSSDLGFKAGDSSRRRISMTFPPLWLQPGLYSIWFTVTFSASSASRKMIRSNSFPLDITGESSAGYITLKTTPVLHPAVCWSSESCSTLL